ncbi:hypothetical protein D3C73_551160 [compost metagenome]
MPGTQSTLLPKASLTKRSGIIAVFSAIWPGTARLSVCPFSSAVRAPNRYVSVVSALIAVTVLSALFQDSLAPCASNNPRIGTNTVPFRFSGWTPD